jgi:lysylphosphatidylglycerol synthetase-like protein (DUF2156 family)
MARSIIAVVASYLLMFVLTFIIFSGMWMVLGADGSFKPGTFESSTLWTATALVASFVIAVIAGVVCAAIARGGKAPLVLAIIVFVLGLVLAIPSLVAKRANAGLGRTSGDISMFEAMQLAQEPDWAPFSLPFIGAAGVLIGAKLKRRG